MPEVNKFIQAVEKDKYWLPTLNWALFTAICALIALYYLGLLYGASLAIISGFVFGPIQKFSPNTIKYFSKEFSNLSVSTHFALFIVQISLLVIGLWPHHVREKLWKIFQNSISKS